ncbi:hypothetical protein CERSUDRAFT_74340 [Gelatoporia subvermispora B]|uniref:Uncharacterized protein n=1 Tax=Ceriporiopsis subvermispora (strain B) TaxID=914234 RepID=M2PJG8_CERS8|nr:hypothetical protein CERSUDRAFT_74340 [Gelatoporia subvermispora B]
MTTPYIRHRIVEGDAREIECNVQEERIMTMQQKCGLEERDRSEKRANDDNLSYAASARHHLRDQSLDDSINRNFHSAMISDPKREPGTALPQQCAECCHPPIAVQLLKNILSTTIPPRRASGARSQVYVARTCLPPDHCVALPGLLGVPVAPGTAPVVSASPNTQSATVDVRGAGDEREP